MHKHGLGENRGSYVPIWIILSYLAFTLFSFIFMQRDATDNMGITVLYCMANFLAIGIGYMLKPTLENNKDFNYTSDTFNKICVKFICFCAISTIVVSINNLLPFYPDIKSMAEFILDPGKAYEYVKFLSRNNLVQTETGFTNSVIGVTLNVFSFTKYYLFGFSFLYWQKLNKRCKTLVVISSVIYLVHSLLIGAMVNIGTLFFAVLPFLLVKKYWNVRDVSQNQEKPVKKQKVSLILISIVVFLLITYFLGNRNVFKLEGGQTTGVLTSGVLGLLFYLSHGYVGLAECFNLSFKCTFGQTSFRGIFTTISPYLGMQSLFSDSYLLRNEIATGRPALQVWSTIFPWLASDITFWLIPVIMIIIGYMLKKSWTESLLFRNPFALALLGQLFIFCFMIPANNQLFHTFGNSMGAIIVFLIYCWSKRFVTTDKKICIRQHNGVD